MGDLGNSHLAIDLDHFFCDVFGKVIWELCLPMLNLCANHHMVNVDQDDALRKLGVMWLPCRDHPFVHVIRADRAEMRNAACELDAFCLLVARGQSGL